MTYSFSAGLLDALIDAVERRRVERQEALDQEFTEAFRSALAKAGRGVKGSCLDKEAAKIHASTRRAHLKQARQSAEEKRSLTADDLYALYAKGALTPRRQDIPRRCVLPQGGFPLDVPPQATRVAGCEADPAQAPTSIVGSMRRWLSALLRRGDR